MCVWERDREKEPILMSHVTYEIIATQLSFLATKHWDKLDTLSFDSFFQWISWFITQESYTINSIQ